MGRLPGSVAQARVQRRRRGAPGGAVAGLGDHHRRSTRARSGRRCGAPCRATRRRCRSTAGSAISRRAPAVVVGHTGVLPRVQRRQRRPRARDRICSRACDDRCGQRSKPCDSDRRHSTCQRAEFREIGHRLVDQIADRLARLPAGPRHARRIAGRRAARARGGAATAARRQRRRARWSARRPRLLFDHSLFNGHPRFFGYITSSPAPIGMFGDFLAAAVNQNVGAWQLSPLATEIERQTVRWIAELIGFPADCGGLLVSGGNMANFICFIAARAAKAGWRRAQGRPCARASAPARVCVSRDAYVAAESRRPRRARHRRDPVDCD